MTSVCQTPLLHEKRLNISTLHQEHDIPKILSKSDISLKCGDITIFSTNLDFQILNNFHIRPSLRADFSSSYKILRKIGQPATELLQNMTMFTDMSSVRSLTIPECVVETWESFPAEACTRCSPGVCKAYGRSEA